MHRLLVIAAAGLAALVGSGPAGAWSWPADGDVLRPFGLGGDAYAAGQHRGVDVAGAEGSPVRSPASGTVSFAGTLPTYGRGVTIVTADGYAVTLVHLGSIGVAKGDAVTEGAPIGSMGWSGDPEHDVPTVHLGVRVETQDEGYVDPLGLLPPRSAAPAPSPPTAAPATAPAAPPVTAPARASAPAPPPSQPATPAPPPPQPSTPIAIHPAAPSPQVGGNSAGSSSAPTPAPGSAAAAVVPQAPAPTTVTTIEAEAVATQSAPADAPFRVDSRPGTSTSAIRITDVADGTRPRTGRGPTGTTSRGLAFGTVVPPARRSSAASPARGDAALRLPPAGRSTGAPTVASARTVVAPEAVGSPHRPGRATHVGARLDAGVVARPETPRSTASPPLADGIAGVDEHGGPRRGVLAALGLLVLFATAAAARIARRIGGNGAVLRHHADLLRQLHAAHRARLHDRGGGRVRTPSTAARP